MYNLYFFGVLGVYDAIKRFVDKIFSVPIAFLDLAREKLSGAATVTRQGLNFNQYMSFFADLPSYMQLVLKSLLSVTVILATLVMFRALMRMYFTVKSGVKWW